MFKYEQYVDMTDINDSMEMNSGVKICSLEQGDRFVYVMTRGSVTLQYKGEYYSHAGEFPEELKKMFHTGEAWDSNDVYIYENNWFEVFYGDNGSESIPYAEVVDIERSTPSDLLELCLEFIGGR